MAKRLICILIAVLILAMPATTFAQSSELSTTNKVIIGDADNDQKISVLDATMIQRHLAKLSSLDSYAQLISDVDNDQKLTILDATTIQRFLAKLIDEFDRKSINENANTNEYGLATDLEQGTIFHAWCWSFNTISENLENIAASGFTSVQTSPISQCLVGEDGGMQIYGAGKWYYHYQPTKFVIGNYQLGTKDEFIAMCDKAHSLGMNIIVDAVVNHCSSTYEAIDPSVTEIEGGAFHSMDNMWWSQDDRYHETQGALSLLWDLNTQNPNVQQMIKNYLVDCVNSGADGFRYDTAKLIELPDDYVQGYPAFASDFWNVVLNNGAKWQYGENLQDAADLSVCRLKDYSEIMDVTCSKYGEKIRECVDTDNLNVLEIEDYLVDDIDPEKLVTWVESHDNYCNEKSWSYIDEQESVRAWAIIAARKGGTPLYFSRPMGSTTEDPWGNNQISVEGSDLYKDSQIVEVNFFRNEMGEAVEHMSNPSGNNKVLMIERGQKGCVIINSSDNDIAINTRAYLMADGTYTDQVSGNSFTVSDGVIKGTVKSGRVAVIYNKESQRLTHSSDVSLSVASSNFYTDTLTITMTSNNCTNTYYQLDNGTKVPFNNGDTLTIGQTLNSKESVTVTLSATTTDSKTITESATYTKYIPQNKTRVYLDKTAFPNWQDVYVYIYNDSGLVNANWPGEKMTKLSNNKYEYILSYQLEKDTSYVIFNNGSGGENNQYPTADGLSISKNQKMMLNYSKVWESYPLKTLYFKNTLGWDKVNAYYWGDESTSWPGVEATKVDGTSDIYSITLFGDNTSVIFNNTLGEQTRDIACFVEGQMFTPTTDYSTDQWDQKIYSGELTQYTSSPLGEIKDNEKTIYLRSTDSWFIEDNPEVYVYADSEKIKMIRCENSLCYMAYIPKDTQSVYFTRCTQTGTILNNIVTSNMGSYNCYTVTSATKGTWNTFSYNDYENAWTFYFDNSVLNMSTPYVYAWGGDGLTGFAPMTYVEGSVYKYTFIVTPQPDTNSFLVVDGNVWGGTQTIDLSYSSSYNMYNGKNWSKYSE